MNSTTPPPPKQGGSGPFIIAALVMLLLMGGLIYWKVSGDTEAPVSTPLPVATAAPVLEEAPPPPPPIEVPKDAGVESKQPARKLVGNSVGGCGGECKGEASPNLRSTLTAKAGAARGCYERALRQNNMLQGRMRIALRIGPNGSVCHANVAQNGLGDPGVASCVLQIFRAATFPSPQGGCVDAEVPLNFEPQK